MFNKESCFERAWLTHLTQRSVGSLEIKLQQVSKDGQGPRPWRFNPHLPKGETSRDQIKYKQQNNSAQNSGGTGEEKEDTILQKIHLLCC